MRKRGDNMAHEPHAFRRYTLIYARISRQLDSMELERKVEDMPLSKNLKVRELIEQMERSGGFTVKKLAVAWELPKATS